MDDVLRVAQRDALLTADDAANGLIEDVGAAEEEELAQRVAPSPGQPTADVCDGTRQGCEIVNAALTNSVRAPPFISCRTCLRHGDPARPPRGGPRSNACGRYATGSASSTDARSAARTGTRSPSSYARSSPRTR